MKDKLDLYSIEIITIAFAHYIVTSLQKSEKENKKKKILDYTYLHLIFTIFFFFFSSPATRDTRKIFDYV
jgi:hypothetical protein